ncbi:MAG: hypothetical protein HRU26_18170 [Psychroserpens sp.]|nr:hypothetical protein [Psychroserpens sp.]
MSKTIHRIIDLVTALGLSARQFDISIGTANGYTLRMKKNNASVGSDVIERIKQKYPQVNLVWLITGKGEMFLNEIPDSKGKSKAEVRAYIVEKLESRLTIDKKVLLQEILEEIDKS